MGEVKGKSQDAGSDWALYGLGGVVLLGVVFWLLARLPGFVIGSVIGLMAMSNFKSRDQLASQVKAFIGTTLISYFGLYVCFGFQGLYDSDFGGILIKFEWYQNFVVRLCRLWNEEVPGFLKGLHVTGDMVTTGNISRLIITASLFGSVFSVLAPMIYKAIKKEKNSEISSGKFENMRPSMFSIMSEFVYMAFYYLVERPLSMIINRGNFLAIEIRSLNLKALVHVILVFVVLLGVAVILEKLPGFMHVQSREINVFTEAMAGLPILAFAIGVFVGLIPSIGDTALFHLTGAAPSAAKIISRSPREQSGFVLGFYGKNKPYTLTERNLNHHIQIVAPSGGGKTNIIKNFLEDRIKKGHGVIFLDYKADFELAEFICEVAKESNREEDVRVFSLSNREISVPYNPISHGSASELASRLMNAFQWSEPYYRAKAESALLKLFRGLCELRDKGAIKITLKTVYESLHKKGYARELSQKLKLMGMKEWEALEEVAEMLDRPSEAKDLQGLITNLEKVIYSGAGELLTSDSENGAFTIDEAMSQGRISYFLMNSLSHKETANSVGKLLLQDLMGYVGRAYDDGASNKKPITIIIDEFAEFAIPEFPSFLNRVRGAGIGVMIAHQTRGDLKAISPDYQNKIEANTNTKIVAGVIDPDDAQFYSALIGTKTVQKETHQVTENGGLLALGDTRTGMKSVRDVEEFIVHPNRVKNIRQGEALVISRTVDVGFGLVFVPKAKSSQIDENSKTELRDALKETRNTYLMSTAPGLTTKQKPTLHRKATPDLWA